MRPFVLVSLVLLILPATSRGDQVSDRIENAKKLYEEGSYSRAVSELKAAIASIQSLQADGLKDAFPKPLPGWSADEPVSAQAGMQFLSGGIAIRRRYRREGEEGEGDEMMAHVLLLGGLGPARPPDSVLVQGAGCGLARRNTVRVLLALEIPLGVDRKFGQVPAWIWCPAARWQATRRPSGGWDPCLAG